MVRCKNYRRNASAVAQKERQGTEQVTKSQSLTLVKNLVRVSISTVCYLRNIFPDSCFQERSYAGMRIYQLDSASRDASTNETVIRDEQAYMLTQWIESGVFEAIERRYLRRMEFIVVSPELNLPREAYSFELDYPDNENDHDMTFSGTKVTTVESTKGQLVKLIRSLIQFSNTLEEVPNERIINMKLWYFDERTPADWEPKYFTAADPSDLCFKREGDHDNLRIRIGELRTPHHTLKVGFKGIDSTLSGNGDRSSEEHDAQGVPADKDAMENEDSSGSEDDCNRRTTTRRSEPGNLLSCEAGPQEDDEEEEEEDDEEETLAEEPAAPAASRDVSKTVSGMMTQLDVSAHGRSDADEEEGNSEMDVARAWVMVQTRPSITGLMSHLQISRDRAKNSMQRMVAEGLLTKDSNYRYHLVNPPLSKTEGEGKAQTGSNGGRGEIDTDDTCSSSSQESSDDSATQDPDAMTEHDHRRTPSSMPPPPPRSRRRGNETATLEGSTRTSAREFATPPVPCPGTKMDLQPVPEKPQQAMIFSMAPKRVLDEAELSDKDEDDTQQSEPMEVFNPPTGTIGSMSTLGYEVSLSQASSVSSRTRKCSLARDPIRQSGPKKKLRMNGGGAQRRD